MPSSDQVESQKSMHAIDIDVVDMTLDVAKYVINRITHKSPPLGAPRTAAELKTLTGETITEGGIGGERAFELFKKVLAPATVPIDHPRHLAFVPAAPTRAAIMFDLVTAASSIHAAYWLEGAGAIFAENEAMRWLVSLTGLPESAFGVFTSGGTAASLSALVTARDHWRGNRAESNFGRGIIICSAGAHSSVRSVAKIIDAEVLMIPTEDNFTGTQLAHALGQMSVNDRSRLFAVVATAGTTNAGIIDDLSDLGALCQREKLWFHIDAAYGGGALASPKYRPLFDGIELADSITIDPHKWLFSPYDCGAILYRNPDYAKAALAQDGAYLDIFQSPGSQGFNPADYQIQLTRRARGLPLWFSLAMYGTDKYAWAIEEGIKLADLAAEKIALADHLELVRPQSLSVVLFRRLGWQKEDYINWTHKHHQAGDFLVAPTKWRNGNELETIARFCFINPHTTEEDIDLVLRSME